MPKQLSWLHLSDIHFCAKDAWRDSSARQSLLAYLKKEIGKSLPIPDIIFCTGDIAFGELRSQSLEKQYDDAQAFLLEVVSIIGKVNALVDGRRLFIVPGNHDVNRDEVNADAQAYIKMLAKELPERHVDMFNNRIASTNVEYRHAMRRLSAFRKFLSAVCPHIALGDSHLHYTHALSINGIGVQVVGLNSAWNCAGDEEERRLWIGAQAQLSGVVRDESLRIGLVHHPLEWMTKPDSSLLEKRMGLDLHYLLHGHEHEYREAVFQGCSVIGTGAVSAETSNEHAVVLQTIDFETQYQDIHVLVHSTADGRWHRSGNNCKKNVNISEDLITHIGGEAVVLRRTSRVRQQPQYSQFFVREGRFRVNDEYRERVERSASTRNRDSDKFRNLWRDIFNHHCVNRLVGDPHELHYQKDDASRLFSKDNIDAYFMRVGVAKPMMTGTANDDIVDKNDMSGSFDEFVKFVSDPAIVGEPNDGVLGENRIVYLIGSTGIGKTLTVLKLCDILRSTQYADNTLRPIPVYKDIHAERAWDQDSPEKALAGSLQALGREFLMELSLCGKELNIPSDLRFDSAVTAEEQMKQLCLIAAKANLYPVFVIDNGDRFFFENAKYRFFPEYARKQEWRLEDTLAALIDRFVSEHALGKIGACVLLVCRKYVYHYCLRDFDDVDPVNPVRRDHKVFQVMDIETETIVASRMKVFETALSNLDSYINVEMFKEQFEDIRRLLGKFDGQRKAAFIDMIRQLTHQGHRSFLNFISRLPFDVRRNSDLVDRLLHTPHVLLRLYIANMCKRYTERQGHFPNIYLNDCTINPAKGFERAHFPHIHTYWLRYLILKYASNQGGDCHSERVIEFFTDQLGYEDNLVRLSIGFLSDPSTSNCFDIVMPDELKHGEEMLKLSRRGDILVNGVEGKEPLCFSFDYLQLITDDFLLALPRAIAKEIFVNANLGHTLKDGPEYAAGARNVLRLKIPAVVRFFLVLEASFKAEMRYRNTEMIIEDFSPDFEKIGEKLISSIEDVLAKFEGENLFKNQMTPRATWKNPDLRSRIDTAISEYYGSPVNVGI